MGTIHAHAEWTTDDLLAAVKRLPPAELGEFQRRYAAWRRQKNGAGPMRSGDGDEAALLAQIRDNSSLPGPDQRRFNRLRRKRQAERLSQSEAKELQALWQRVEQMNVERLRAFCALARQRGTDLDTLQCQLGMSETLLPAEGVHAADAAKSSIR
jgi:hypothetical protein